MRYIVKKSVVQKDPTLGGIFDTLNIENEEENTYSARIIKDIMNLTELEDLSSEATNINTNATTKRVEVYKYGRIISLNFIIERSGTWSDGAILFNLSEKIRPIFSTFFTGCGAGNSIKHLNINAVTGDVKIVGDVTNSAWLAGQIVYLSKETTD